MLWHKAIGAGGVGGGGGGIELVGWQYLATWENATSGTDSFGTWTNGSYSSLEPGDIVFIISTVGSETSDQNFTVSGYTEVSDLYANDTNDTNIAVHYKVMSDPVDTSVSWSVGTTSGATVSAIAFRGVDTSTPLDVTKVDGTGTNATTVTFSSITPSTSGAWILAIAGSTVGDGLVSSLENLATLSINSSEFDSSYNQWAAIPNDYPYSGDFTTVSELDYHTAMAIAWKSDWSSGAFTPTAWTNTYRNSTSDSFAFCLLALRPA